MAAAMTTKSPFVAPIQKLDLAQAAKVSMAISCSDHLTVYKAFIGYESNFKNHLVSQSKNQSINSLMEL